MSGYELSHTDLQTIKDLVLAIGSPATHVQSDVAFTGWDAARAEATVHEVLEAYQPAATRGRPGAAGPAMAAMLAALSCKVRAAHTDMEVDRTAAVDPPTAADEQL
eukprot:6204429-Prymnesium_polylepis.1